MNTEYINQLNDLHEIEEHEIIVQIIENIPMSLWNYELKGLLARAYNNICKFDKALELLTSIEYEGSNDSLWYFRTGYSYFFKDEFKLAKKLFEKSKELGEESASEFINWCNLYLAEEENLKAERQWFNFTKQFADKLSENNNDWSKLSEIEQELAALWQLEINIYDGGFIQYYFNSGHKSYLNALRGLTRLGAFESLTIIQYQFNIIKKIKKEYQNNNLWQTQDFLTHDEEIELCDDLDKKYWNNSDNILEKTFITYSSLINKA